MLRLDLSNPQILDLHRALANIHEQASCALGDAEADGSPDWLVGDLRDKLSRAGNLLQTLRAAQMPGFRLSPKLGGGTTVGHAADHADKLEMQSIAHEMRYL